MHDQPTSPGSATGTPPGSTSGPAIGSVAGPAAGSTAGTGAAPGADLGPIDEADLTSASVLVVDDNEQNLELLQAYLEDIGCEIRSASDGVEAMRAVEERPPDLILLDVMMPRMSGFQVCAKIKEDASLRDIPIVMVTALNEISDVERAVECGADDFLTKPVQRIELVTRVKSLLRVRLLKRQLEKALEQMKRLSRED